MKLRRDYITLGVLLPVLPVSFAAAQQDRPNVLLILTDDQGWGDVAAHGNSLINTPNLDRLHGESVVMERFFVSPLSAPTRASILTGRYHLRTGVSNVESGLENMRPEETTIAELFREAGYATGCFGKWHNGTYYPYTPNGQGFDEFVGFCCGHWANYFDPMLQRNEEMFRGEGYITDIFTDAALRFIDENADKPFFCYVPYNAPHSPFMVPDSYFDKYSDVPAASERDRVVLASIYGMVECVDDNIGRLIERLDKLGIRENTIVVFMTDNGPVHVERYNGDMRGGKGTVHEGGVRVPCYFSWPGTLQPASVGQISAHIDILPTLMDLCGIANYQTAFPVDGISMAGIIASGPGKLPDRHIFTHRLQKPLAPWLGGLRTDDYRLTVYKDRTMLFDMTVDPSETTDIFDPGKQLHSALLESYINWFEDARTGVADKTDVPVGYRKAPQVRIPTPEGEMYGSLKCYGYPNQNWVNHFRTPADSLCFTIDVVESGRFDVILEYSHDKESKGSEVFVSCNGQGLSAAVPVFMSERLSPEPRFDVGEAPEMSWGKLRVGTLELDPGKHAFRLFAENIPDAETMKIKTVIIQRL